jgi:hypothetical protein
MMISTTATVCSNYVCWSQPVSLAPTPSQDQYKVPCQEVKGNKPMYVDNDKHIESSKINYLNDRRENLFYSKRADLQKQFGLVDDEAPITANDLVKRIQDGKFVIPTDKGDAQNYEATRFIKWRDPAAKKDQAGYDAAIKQYAVANQDTKDVIAIGTPAEGLAAVKALDAWTPTVGTA